MNINKQNINFWTGEIRGEASYLIQDKNDIFKKFCINVLFGFATIIVIFAFPIIGGFIQGTNLLQNYYFFVLIKIVALLYYLQLIFSTLCAICFGCNVQVIYDTVKKNLIVNGNSHTIKNITIYPLMIPHILYRINVNEILTFTLDDDSKVSIFSFGSIPYFSNNMASFNITYKLYFPILTILFVAATVYSFMPVILK